MSHVGAFALENALADWDSVAEASASAIEKKRRSAFWTAQRDAILIRDWPRNVPAEQILAALQELPGRPVKYSYVKCRAHQLNLRRPPEIITEIKRDSVSRRWRPNDFAPKTNTPTGGLDASRETVRFGWEPVVASAETIAEWARAQKMSGRCTLAEINARRRDLDVPEFTLLRRPV